MSSIIKQLTMSLSGMLQSLIEIVKSLFHSMAGNLTLILGVLLLLAIFTLLDDAL